MPPRKAAPPARPTRQAVGSARTAAADRRSAVPAVPQKFISKAVEYTTPPAVATSGPDVDVPAGWEDADEARSTLMPAADWQEPGEYVAGEYLGFIEGIGPNKSRQYRFTLPTGEAVCVWGTTILDQRMDDFAPAHGEQVMIQFIGDVATGRGLNPAHNFR